MDSMTFLVNGATATTGQNNSAAWITTTALEDGKLSFMVIQSGDAMGDLRGVFFDADDAETLGTLKVNVVSNKVSAVNESKRYLQNGTDMNGSLVVDGECDAEIGADTDGKSANSYNFTLSSNKRKLALSDFTNIQLDFCGANNNDKNSKTNFDYNRNWLYMSLA